MSSSRTRRRDERAGTQQRPVAELSRDIGLALFNPHQYARLLENGKRSAERQAHGQKKIDYHPVVKLIDPISNAVWLVTEIDPTLRHIAVGLIDLSSGAPAVGKIDLRDLVSQRQSGELAVRPDPTFKSAGRLSSYAQTAQAIGRVIA